MIWKHRYTVLGILFLAYMLCYLDRMAMASAIPFIAHEFHLSSTAMGAVMSAFFAGYALMQIPGGVLADRLGPRAVLTFSIAWWSVMTALSGAAPGLASLLAVRVLFGFGEGPFPSAASKALSVWFPRRELGRATGLQQASSAVGAAAAPLAVAGLVLTWGWRAVFYALSAPGIVIALVVWRYVRNARSDSRHVTGKERAEFGSPEDQHSVNPTSLAAVLGVPAVWWCAGCLFLANLVAWGLMSWLPTYLLQARGFSVEKMGTFAAITNLAGALGYVWGGYLCDRFFAHRMQMPIIVGLLLSAAFTYLAAVAPTGEWAVAGLVAVFLFSNMAFTALFTIVLVIVPKQDVGSAFGVVNTAGQLAGVLSPVLIGYVLSATHGNFELMLYGLVGLTFVAIYPATQIKKSFKVGPIFQESQ